MASRLGIPIAPIVVALAVVAIGYLAFSTARYVVHNYQLRGEEQQLQRDVDQLERDHEDLTAVRDYLESDEYIEYVARRTLGLVRPGETLVVVSGSEPVAAAPLHRTPGAPWWKDLFEPGDAHAPTATPTASGE